MLKLFYPVVGGWNVAGSLVLMACVYEPFANKLLHQWTYILAEPYQHGSLGRVWLFWLATLNLGFGAWRYPRVTEEVAAMPTLKVSQLQQGITMEERMNGTARDAMYSWQVMTSELIRRGNARNESLYLVGSAKREPKN